MMGRRRIGARLSVAFAVFVGSSVATAVAVPTGRVSALTTYVVDATVDEPWDGTTGTCSSAPSGACTLRAALEVIADALANAGFDDFVVDLTALPRGSAIEVGSTL